MKGSVILTNTYANSLDQTGAKLLYKAYGIHNFITLGSDAVNNLTKVPVPKSPIFHTIDT